MRWITTRPRLFFPVFFLICYLLKICYLNLFADQQFLFLFYDTYYLHVLLTAVCSLWLLLLIIGSYLPRFLYHCFWLSIWLLSTSLFIANHLHLHLMNDAISVLSISSMSQLRVVSDSIFAAINHDLWFYFIDTPFLLLLWKQWLLPIPSLNKRDWSFVMLLFFACTLSIVGIQESFQRSEITYRNMSAYSLYKVGPVNYHLYDIYQASKDLVAKDFLTPEEEGTLSQLNRSKSVQNSTFGVLKGRNIVFIQWETLQQNLVGLMINGLEVTPHLNKLMEKSYVNTYFINQVAGGHSSDAEYSLLTSQYPFLDRPAFAFYHNTPLPSLANILVNAGYRTLSTHNFSGDFWGRERMHKHLGIQETDFLVKDYNLDVQEFLWGYYDDTLFQYGLSLANKQTTPFSLHMITVQNHTPSYIRPESDGGTPDIIPNVFNSPKIDQYLESVHQTDAYLGDFLEAAAKTDWYANTVFVIYGDHDLELPEEDVEIVTTYLLKEDASLLRTHPLQIISQDERVPFIIYAPNSALNGIDNKPMTTVDIAPSLLHLLGHSIDIPFVGQNIFDERSLRYAMKYPNLIFFEKHALYQYPNEPIKRLNLRTGHTINATDEEIRQYTQLHQLWHLSNRAVKHNHYTNIN